MTATGTALFQCLQCWSLDASVRSSVSFCAKRNTNCVVYLDTLDEFLMPVRFWKSYAPMVCTMHIERHFLIQCFLANGLEGATLSHRYLIRLTLKPLTYSSGSTYKMLFRFHNCPTLPECAESIRAAVTATVTPMTFSNAKTSLHLFTLRYWIWHNKLWFLLVILVTVTKASN
jgi:hypothetical protein